MMGELSVQARKWMAAALLALLASACVGGSRPYWAVEPIHHVRNSPIPVPRPALKPAPPQPKTVAAVAQPDAAAVRPQPRPDSAEATRSIRVDRGDTVYGLARANGVGVRDLVALNGLEPPYLLRVGQRLQLPAPRTHVVRRGETPFSIAQTHGVEPAELIRANALAEPRSLRPGAVLRIPASAEEEVQVASRASVSLPDPPARTSAGFDWPLAGTIVSTFGAKGGGLRNDGLNIAAPRGTPVRAAEAGVVAYTGDGLKGFGKLILVRHAGGWVTAYAHNDAVLVERGDRVRRGQTIARVGTTGSVTRPQLHFEVRRGTRALDPTELLPTLHASAR